MIAGVKFDRRDEKLVVSSNHGSVKIFDLNKKKKVQEYHTSDSKVGSLSLFDNSLLTGNKNGEIFLHDIRQ